MKKIKLLLVDDHQMILDGLNSFLEKQPEMEVVGFANNGQQAIDLLESSMDVDVIVLDIIMPILEGMDAAKIIRKKHPKVKIILLSMKSDRKNVKTALSIGVQGYIVKEKSKEALIQAIHSVYNGSIYYSPELLATLENFDLDIEETNNQVELTDREKEILCLMVEEPAFTAKQISDKLYIADVTVSKHIQNMKKKLNMNKGRELIKFAMDNNLCSK